MESIMRIAEYKQIDTELVKETIIDEDGNETEVKVEKPVFGLVYRDMTEEEENEIKNAEVPIVEETPSVEDLLDALNLLTDIVLGGE